MQVLFTYVPFGNQWGSTNNVLEEKTLAVILQVSRDHFFLLKTDLSLEDHSFLRNNVCLLIVRSLFASTLKLVTFGINLDVKASTRSEQCFILTETNDDYIGLVQNAYKGMHIHL